MKTMSLDACKYLMIFFNLAFFMCGILLLGVGLWGFIAKESFSKIISSDPALTNTVVVMMFVGTILVVVGFFGCTGAIRESKCLLTMFAIIVFLLFAAEIAGIVLIQMFYPKVAEFIEGSMSHYKTSELVRSVWDSVQSTFQCCGFHDYKDWVGVATGGNGTYPHSCCKQLEASTCMLSNSAFNWPGCEKGVISNLWLILLVASVILIIEISAIIFSCCICKNISKKYEEDY